MPNLPALVEASPVTLAFTGSSIPYTFFTVTPPLPVTVRYKQAQGEFTLDPPIYPGSYSVEIVVDENTGYFGAATVDFTITKATSVITFLDIPPKTFNDPQFPIIASSTSGYPVSLMADNTAVLGMSGNNATILNVGPGFVNIVASEGSPYHIATPVVKKVFISRANQSLTVQTLENINTRTLPFQITASSSSGLGLVYSLLQGPVSLTPSGFVSVLDDGPVVVKVDQPGSQNYNPASATVSFSISPFVQTFQEGVSSFLGTASQREACPIPAAQDYLLCEPAPGVWPSLQNPISGVWERVELWWEYVKKTENW